MKEPEIDIEEDSTDIEVIEIDSDTIDGAAADSDAASNIQNVSEENDRFGATFLDGDYRSIWEG